MVDLTQSQIDILKEILQRLCPEIEVYAFGSRTKGSARPYSDLDLLLVGKQPLGWKKIEAIKQVLSESDLPFLVDVVDWQTVDETFKKQIGNRVKIC